MTLPITLCGSLSKHPVSLGAAMHQAGYAALGLAYVYVPFAVDDLEGALTGMRALQIRGFGVSMPYKLDVIPLLDGLDALAADIGAVNTIVNDAGTLTGYNTDAWGAARALEEATAIAGKRVVVIGAGGAARAVAYSLSRERAELHVVNRSYDKARALATELSVTTGRAATAGPLSDTARLENCDVLINCSSAGMHEYGAGSPVPATQLRPEMVIMDIVYKPIETELLRAARERGAKTVHGGRMLLHQACRQFELYTGRTAPLREMDGALRRAIGPH
jgi:shikimate dehydrogenase